MNMEEVRSNVGSSTHSLYPAVVCVANEAMQQSSVSIVSNQSDYYTIATPITSNNSPASTDEESGTAKERMIPLANLDKELKLSALSISSR